METGKIRRWTLGLLLVLILVLSLSPAVLAEGNETVYAIDSDGNSYTSVESAWNAAKNGKTKSITMQQDWVLSSPLTLGSNESAVINMNGKRIKRNTAAGSECISDGEVFHLNSGASLTLRGCNEKIEYSSVCFGYDMRDEWDFKPAKEYGTGTFRVGGLVTGGKSSNTAGAIQMDGGSTLLLDHVAVAGNESTDHGGAIQMDGHMCNVYLENGASLEGNYCPDDGGAVYIDGQYATVRLRGGSHIYNNASLDEGAGIYIDDSYAAIVLGGNSEISSNVSKTLGGGIYVNDTHCSIRSEDGTGKFTDNVATTSGGAIYVNYGYATIKDLTLDGNSCGASGGAIYLNADDCVLDGCTVTGNNADDYGGGIFCEDDDDLYLKGKVIVAENTNKHGEGNYANLFLDSIDMVTFRVSKSCLQSAPAAGSWIGISADMFAATERKIGEDDVFSSNVFFSDLDNFHVEASGNELYLKQGTRYVLKVNGVPQGCFAEGEVVTIDGTAEYPKVFQSWKAVDGVKITDSSAAITTITMPKSDVNIEASYAEYVYYVTLEVDAPEAGKPLAETGKVSMKTFNNDPVTYNEDNTVDIIWLTQENGQTRTVSGTAEYGKSYLAAAVFPQDPANGILFDNYVTAQVVYTGEESMPINRVKLDESGALRIYGQLIETDRAKVQKDVSIQVDIGIGSSTDALQAALPDTVVLETNDGEKIVNLDYQDKLTEVDLNEADIYTVTPSVDYETLNLDANGTTVTVLVSVISKGALASPMADVSSGTYTAADTGFVTADNESKSIKMKVTLTDPNTAVTGSSIRYTLIASYDAASGEESKRIDETYNSENPIELEAAHGERVTYLLSVYSTATNYDRSAAVTYTYVLDNPYTVTIHGIDTGKKTGGAAGELYDEKTFTYRKGNPVVIGAPAVDGELFEKWINASGIEIDGQASGNMTLKVNSIQSDIDLTAVYNPVITEIEITMDAPQADKALPTSGYRVMAACAAYPDQPYNVTDLFQTITWQPDAEKAEEGIVYTAALAASADASESGKTLLSESLKIDVKDSKGEAIEAKTAAQAENGNRLTLYVTFPAVAAEQKDHTPSSDSVRRGTTEDSEKSDLPFVDVETDDWFREDVVYVYENGLFSGTGETTFSPDADMTRAMLVTVLYRLEEQPAVQGRSDFTDVTAGSYYEDAVIWAARNGIVNGTSAATFSPDAKVTREQLAAILYRYAQYRKYNTDASTSLNGFSDHADVSAYAVTPMQWAVAESLINGANGKLMPTGTATRAQVAAILHRFVENIA